MSFFNTDLVYVDTFQIISSKITTFCRNIMKWPKSGQLAKTFLGGKTDRKMAKFLEFGHGVAKVGNPVLLIISRDDALICYVSNLEIVGTMTFFCWIVLIWVLGSILAWLSARQPWAFFIICINTRWPPKIRVFVEVVFEIRIMISYISKHMFLDMLSTFLGLKVTFFEILTQFYINPRWQLIISTI